MHAGHRGDLGSDPRGLIGIWTFNRTLHDLASGQRGCAHGTLAVTASSGGLRWDESGVMSWNGLTAPVSRELVLVQRADFGGDADWWMTFADGRPFHPWRPGLEVDHPCRADRYRGLIETSQNVGVDRMRMQWHVSGPAKEHRYVTRFRRAS